MNSAVKTTGSRSVASTSMVTMTSQLITNSFCVLVIAAGVIPNQLCISPSTSTA